jgi:threonine dehydratase
MATSRNPSHTASTKDLGKVLAGIQVPPEDALQFSVFLEELGYQYVEETENEVSRLFLSRR